MDYICFGSSHWLGSNRMLIVALSIRCVVALNNHAILYSWKFHCASPDLFWQFYIEMQTVLLLSIKPKKKNRRKSLSLWSHPCNLSDGSFNSALRKCYPFEKLYLVSILDIFKYERKEQKKHHWNSSFSICTGKTSQNSQIFYIQDQSGANLWFIFSVKPDLD